MNGLDNTLHPFFELSECPKCGSADHSCDDKEAACQRPCRHIRTRYCAGGKPVTEDAPVNPMMALGRIMESAQEGKTVSSADLTRTEINLCAGVGEEHLHKTCVMCGYEFLTRTKEMHGGETR